MYALTTACLVAMIGNNVMVTQVYALIIKFKKIPVY